MSPMFNNICRRSLLLAASLSILFAMVCSQLVFRSNPATYAYPNLQQVKNIWAGYVAKGPSGTYKGVKSYFIVPTLTSTANGGIDTWVGLSGTTLVQAGVRSNWDSTKSSQANQVWWWVISGNNNSCSIYNAPKIHAGDKILAYVTSNANTDGSNYFMVWDTNTSAGFSIPGSNDYSQASACNPPHQDPQPLADGTAAACVVETHSNTPSNTGLVQFTSCGVSKNDGSQGWIPIGNVQQVYNDPSKFYTQQMELDIYYPNSQTNYQTFAIPNPLNNGSDFSVTLLGPNQAPKH